MPIKACFREGRLATLDAVIFTNPEMNNHAWRLNVKRKNK